MVATQVSGSLIVRDKKILMFFDDEKQKWSVPMDKGERGELSAETAVRVAEEATGCSCDVIRYRSKLKKDYEHGGEEFTLQPYSLEIEGEPEDSEWVHIKEIHEKDIVKPFSEMVEKLKDKL